MSDVVTSGFPAIATTGGSVTGTTSSGRAFGAWECLLLALDKPLTPKVFRGRAFKDPARSRKWLYREVTPDSKKWSFHAVDAVRVILGLDTLYANER